MTNHAKIEAEIIELSSAIADIRAAHQELVDRREKLLVAMFDNGATIADIARLAGMPRAQVQRILRKFDAR